MLSDLTAPKYAGQDVINPASLILSGAMMFQYMGWKEAGALIGALMPPTRAEDRVLGGIGDALREKAAETASTAAERGKAAAAEGLRAARQAYQGAERRRSDTASSPYAGLDRRRGGNGGQPSYDS